MTDEEIVKRGLCKLSGRHYETFASYATPQHGATFVCSDCGAKNKPTGHNAFAWEYEWSYDRDGDRYVWHT